jgi:hypothetical protein
MTNRQKVTAGISIVDADGQPFSSVPPDMTVGFASSDPTVAEFLVDASGLNGEVTSGLVGSCIITATAQFPGGNIVADTLAVAVINSEPGSLNFTVGQPIEE